MPTDIFQYIDISVITVVWTYNGLPPDDMSGRIVHYNYHLEQGKAIREAILDGSRQIVIPATASLLCICLVFMPMFSVGGVAGFLFRLLAEPVIFAMVGSYLLSRTLVPTLANYLLARRRLRAEPDGDEANATARSSRASVARTHAEGHLHAPAPVRNPLVRFQRGFEQRFERIRHGYRELQQLAMVRRVAVAVGFLAVVALLFAPAPFPGGFLAATSI